METLLVTGQGAHIKKKKDLLCVIQNKETPEEERTTHLSPIDLNMIILSGELSITTGALRLLALHDVGLVIMDGYGRPFGHFLPLKKGMIIENVERQRDIPHSRSFPVAQEICRAGSSNKATLIQAVGRSMGIDCRAQVNGIREEVKRIERASSTKEFPGYEGSADRLYCDGPRRSSPLEFGFREEKTPSSTGSNQYTAQLGVRYPLLTDTKYHGIFRAFSLLWRSAFFIHKAGGTHL
jgi:CRISPR-associated protein Cas1